MSLTIYPVHGIPEISEGVDLGGLLGEICSAADFGLVDGDVLVVTQKIVSKAEGNIVDLGQIEPSTLANEFATQYDKDPRLVEVVLRESRRVREKVWT